MPIQMLLGKWLAVFNKIDVLIDWLEMHYSACIRIGLTKIGCMDISLSFDSISREKQSIVISNHISGLDIFLLFGYLNHKLPPLRFIAKQSVFWIPILGLAGLMRGDQFIQKDVSLSRGQTKQSLKKRLQKLRKSFSDILKSKKTLTLFIEGSRVTLNRLVSGPYQYLLPPKSMGLWIALSEVESDVKLVDVTLNYGDKKYTESSFKMIYAVITGKIPVTMMASDKEVKPKPSRQETSDLVDNIWSKKDMILEKIMIN